MSDLNLEGLSDKQLQLFAVRCARRVQYLMTDPRSIKALDVVERHANGQATYEELRTAARAAWAAAVAVAIAAVAAARAAGVAARAAGAARGAAGAAVGAAARDVELAEQQNILNEIRKEEQR